MYFLNANPFALFHLSQFLSRGDKCCEGVVFSPSKCPSNLSVWVFYFIPLLVFPSPDWLLLPSVWILLASILPYRCMLCVCQLTESLKIFVWYSTNLPFFSFSSFLLSSCFRLPVAAAERLYSQLERNRLLSNELKLTLHDLCDWWQGALVLIKPSLLLTPLTWTPAKSWLSF